MKNEREKDSSLESWNITFTWTRLAVFSLSLHFEQSMHCTLTRAKKAKKMPKNCEREKSTQKYIDTTTKWENYDFHVFEAYLSQYTALCMWCCCLLVFFLLFCLCTTFFASVNDVVEKYSHIHREQEISNHFRCAQHVCSKYQRRSLNWIVWRSE